MIKALYIDKVEKDTRSMGDSRKKVDAYFVVFSCSADKFHNYQHIWYRRFEVKCGNCFKMQDFPDKAAAKAASGYTI